jgi:hypothetical protein
VSSAAQPATAYVPAEHLLVRGSPTHHLYVWGGELRLVAGPGEPLKAVVERIAPGCTVNGVVSVVGSFVDASK